MHRVWFADDAGQLGGGHKAGVGAKFSNGFEKRFTRLTNGYGGITKWVVSNPVKALLEAMKKR